MRRLTVLAVMLAIAGLAVSAAWAQRPSFGGGGFGSDKLSLLSQKSVQEELKLSEDQVKKATEVREKLRESFKGFRDLSKEDRQEKMKEQTKTNDKAVADILKPEQLKRLKEISLQQRGSRAFADAEVAEALKITDEQKEKLKTIQEDAGKEFRELFEGAKGDREEARKKMEAMRKTTDEKVMAVLTDAQKTKWKELTGEPFKGEIQRPTFGNRKKKGSDS